MPHADDHGSLTVPVGSRLERQLSWSKESLDPSVQRTEIEPQSINPEHNTQGPSRDGNFAPDGTQARRTRANRLYYDLVQASRATDTELIPKLDTETQEDYEMRLPTDATDKQREITAAERMFHQLWPIDTQVSLARRSHRAAAPEEHWLILAQRALRGTPFVTLGQETFQSQAETSRGGSRLDAEAS